MQPLGISCAWVSLLILPVASHFHGSIGCAGGYGCLDTTDKKKITNLGDDAAGADNTARSYLDTAKNLYTGGDPAFVADLYTRSIRWSTNWGYPFVSI